VVVVHERFTERGGSEAVAEAIALMTDAVAVHAPLVDPAVVGAAIADRVVAGPLQRVYRGGTRYEHLLPLLPRALARTDVGGADLVVVSHHAFANRVRVAPAVPMVSYTHTPARWMWDDRLVALEDPSGIRASALRRWAHRQRAADRAAAQRPDVIVVNSTTVADRVERWWGRSGVVVPPPVDTEYYVPDPAAQREPFVLWAGRLVPYKRPDVAVLAARAAGVRLVVAGDGRARGGLDALAGADTVFLGRVSQPELRRLLQRCRALVFPGEEDFGIVPVEALACGTPVVALDAGGVRDSVVHGEHGVLVDGADRRTEAMVARFAEALRAVVIDEPGRFDPAALRARAEGFSPDAFRVRLGAVLDEVRAGRRDP
jgi:glycosyltransferase involved in cell wall biosynthesis